MCFAPKHRRCRMQGAGGKPRLESRKKKVQTSSLFFGPVFATTTWQGCFPYYTSTSWQGCFLYHTSTPVAGAVYTGLASLPATALLTDSLPRCGPTGCGQVCAPDRRVLESPLGSPHEIRLEIRMHPLPFPFHRDDSLDR